MLAAVILTLMIDNLSNFCSRMVIYCGRANVIQIMARDSVQRADGKESNHTQASRWPLLFVIYRTAPGNSELFFYTAELCKTKISKCYNKSKL